MSNLDKARQLAEKEYPEVFKKVKSKNPNTRNYYEWLRKVAINMKLKELSNATI